MYHFLLRHADGHVSVRLVANTNRHHQTPTPLQTLLLSQTLRCEELRNQLFQVPEHMFFYPARKTQQAFKIIETPVLYTEAKDLIEASMYGDAVIIPASKVIGLNSISNIPHEFPDMQTAVNNLSARAFATNGNPDVRTTFAHRQTNEWYCYDEATGVVGFGISSFNSRREFLMPLTPMIEGLIKTKNIIEVYGCWINRTNTEAPPAEKRGLGRLKQFSRA